MRRGPKAITALLALVCGSAACGGGGGHDSTIIVTRSSFAQGFLPVLFATSAGSGDVTLRLEGDLYAVDGTTSDVTVVSRLNGDVNGGDVTPFATDVGGASNVLTSITVGFGDDQRLFVGDADGKIWSIDPNGTVKPFLNTGLGEPITGLQFAPTGFGGFGGQLFAAAGTKVWRMAGDPTVANPFTNTDGDYVDLAFSATTLFVINATEIETVSASGETAALPNTLPFENPVGMTLDSTASEIYVADAGDSVLYTVPVSGGAPTPRAKYTFDPEAPSGLAYDGFAAIAFVTADPPAIRGSILPRIAPAFEVTFIGPTVGYGDLEFDRSGAFVFAANDPDDPPAGDSIDNFLFSAARDLSTVTALALDRSVVSADEELLGVAVDPKQQVIYFSTRRGNVYQRVADGTVTELVPGGLTDVPVMGLELAPAGFGSYGGWLIATTGINTDPAPDTGEVFAIDPQNASQFVKITLSQPVAHLSDLVFSTDGVLYLVDNNASTSRILRVALTGATTGAVTVRAGPSVQLGLADGIEIDEGGNRLLVASETAGGGKLLAVDRDSGAVSALANIAIDDSFFPTGVIYDRLGTAVVRERDDVTSLRARSVAPPP